VEIFRVREIQRLVDVGYPLMIAYYSLHSIYYYYSHVNPISMSIKLLVALLCIGSTLALFADDSAVFKLTASNFKDQVVNSDDFWLV